MRPKIKPPSTSLFISFPVFALAWHASPPNSRNGCNIVAYCGGGGSARTGVGNSVKVMITTTDGSSKREVTIDTGDEIGVAVCIHQPLVQDGKALVLADFVWVLIGVADEVRFYSISIFEKATLGDNEINSQMSHEDKKKEGIEIDTETAILLTTAHLGKDYGANAVAINPVGHGIAVGCENGSVLGYHIQMDQQQPPSKIHSKSSISLVKFSELKGHIKAICSLKYHPRNPTILMTSAKDGTCRIWNLQIGHEIDVLECKIYDPDGPVPKNANIRNPKPGQLLVRGCAFGDLEGRMVYTVQSGRKGNAFLSCWKLVQVQKQVNPEQNEAPSSQSQTQQGQPPQQQQTPKVAIQFKEQFRKSISPYPVSAMSLSGDFTNLVIGDTNGTVTILCTSTLKTLKKWQEIHDLPVTCIAARPLPMELAGEDKLGIKVDAISASADNKLTSLTLQRKSNLKPVKKVTSVMKHRQRSSCGIFYFSFTLSFILFLAYVATISYELCSDVFTNGTDLNPVFECIWHTVLLAPAELSAISVVPQ